MTVPAPTCWPYPAKPHLCDAHALPLEGGRCALGVPEPEPVQPESARLAREEAAAAAQRHEAERQAAARRTRQQLLDRIAHPERASSSPPYRPEVPGVASSGEQCSGCGRWYWDQSQRQGHAVTSAANGRDRCLSWSLGIV
jgi:hypothetical protein